MATHYLIRNNQVIATIDTEGNVIALPLFGGEDIMSLINQIHVQSLMNSQGWTVAQALSNLGLADLRSLMLKSIFLGSNPVSLITGMVAYHLIDVNSYSLWQVDGQQIDLLALHNLLWDTTPIETLGLLAVVNEFGVSFYNDAVRVATGMTIPEALTRRDRIATYLESLGHTNTTDLRAATTEHDQMIGIATALEYTETQLWNAMVG